MTTNSHIIIVGGGVSGLAAYNQLKNNGFKNITLLEADRLGGRIYTIPFGIIYSIEKKNILRKTLIEFFLRKLLYRNRSSMVM